MVGRPGRTQYAFTAGELDPGLVDNLGIKYRDRGLKRARNIEPFPQGGFQLAEGTRLIGDLVADACRIFDFTASDGSAYDIVGRPGEFEIWGASGKLFTLASPYNAAQLRVLEMAQQYDTAILFHEDVAPRRLRVLAPDNWVLDFAPFTGIPNYDYGGTYINGVAAEWELDFSSTTDASLFTFTVSRQESSAIFYANAGGIGLVRDSIDGMMGSMPNIRPGYLVTIIGGKIRIVFSGAGNEGDGWAVSAEVKNKPDSAIVAYKVTPGVPPGEALMSEGRGWPRAGCFYQQRLLIGGFKSLPNAWQFSIQGDYFNVDDRIGDANGSALVPMDLPGGETIIKMVGGRSLMIFTNRGEYWLQDRALSKTTAPAHVKAAGDGIKRGVPICENEGAALIVFEKGTTVGEFRYSDTEGNFVAASISILSAHLIEGIIGAAIRRPGENSDGALYALVREDGEMRIAKLLRAQDVTAFVRRQTQGKVIDVACNDRNELSLIVERTNSTATFRVLERFQPGLLLDCTETRSFDPPQATITGLWRHDGHDVWVIGDNEIYGPLRVAANAVTLPVAVSSAQIGRWMAPIAELLPPTRELGGGMVLKRKGRIHSVKLKLEDSTSLALAANGGATKDVPLRRWGETEAPTLAAGFSGTIVARGLTNYVEDPTLTITQLRPGRLQVLSVTPEAKL